MKRLCAIVAGILLCTLQVIAFSVRSPPSQDSGLKIQCTNGNVPVRNCSFRLRSLCSTKRSSESTASSSPLIKLASSPFGALAILAFIILFHESGHYLTGRAVGLEAEEFSIGFGPKLLGFQAFGDDFNLRALPLGGYVSFPFTAVQALPTAQRLFVLSAGVLFNQLLAFMIYIFQIMYGSGISKPRIEPGLLVTGVIPDSAAKNILYAGDVILAVNGVPIQMSKSPTAPEAQRTITKTIDTVQATPNGQALKLSIARPGSSSSRLEVTVFPKRATPESPPSVGVYLEPNLTGFDLLKSDSLGEAAILATSSVMALTKETASGFLIYLRDLIRGKTGSSEYRVSGPIGVIKRATEVVKTEDWTIVARYAAALSINLSVLNIFPIPPMDGFQIVITLGEALFTSK
jgi:membrane-associated protease RseP (regulator of RpoE activity)